MVTYFTMSFFLAIWEVKSTKYNQKKELRKNNRCKVCVIRPTNLDVHD